MYDIIFAIFALRAKGVADNRILIFVDHDQPTPHFSPYGIGNVFPFAELTQRLASAPVSSSVVVCVGGHGAELGLSPKGAPEPFKAAALFASVAAIPGVNVGIVLLTQCFGGIFNFAKADGSPRLVVMGGANLNPSLSMTVNLPSPLPQASGAAGLQSWLANVFSYDFFTWIGSPLDVDGDGALTIMDAFKYAGAT